MHRLTAISSVEHLHPLVPPTSIPPSRLDRLDAANPTRANQDLCFGSLLFCTVLIARGISLLNLLCFPAQWELVTYPLLEVWNSPGEDTHCSTSRIRGTWNRRLLHYNTLPPHVPSGHPPPPPPPASLSCSISLLCLRLFEVAYQQIWFVFASEWISLNGTQKPGTSWII